MKRKNFTSNTLKTLRQILCAVAILLFVHSHPAQKNNRVVFYINGDAIAFPASLSMSQIAKSNGQMKYVIREDLRSMIPKRGTLMETNLVRSSRSVYSVRDNNISATKTLDLKVIFGNARPGDAMVLELVGLPKAFPQIFAFQFTE